MIYREKVIKALKHCEFGSFWPFCENDCPYYQSNDCTEKLKNDILVLLKEQEAEWIEYPECIAYDGAYSDSHIVCSACKHVFNIMDNCTEEFDYCPHCGAKMK